jgi:hypothetical protein
MGPRTAKRIATAAGVIALTLFLGGVIAIPFAIGPGKGHNFGPLILAFYLWLFAFAAAVTSVISFAIWRRRRGDAGRQGFEVATRPPGGPPAG